MNVWLPTYPFPNCKHLQNGESLVDSNHKDSPSRRAEYVERSQIVDRVSGSIFGARDRGVGCHDRHDITLEPFDVSIPLGMTLERGGVPFRVPQNCLARIWMTGHPDTGGPSVD